jgi:tRNA pseudouridine55 synthase
MTMIPQPPVRPILSGVVNINKPVGMTSRAAVDVVKRLVHPARTGHAGTLDPLATGVLVVCVGSATRLIEYVQREPKRYRATFLFGQHSPTEDIEGHVTVLPDAPRPSRQMIAAAAGRLTGEILQRPPAFSALKVAGRRSYDLARAGREVAHAPRPIVVHGIDIVDYAYPELTLDIHCGSGTYVRSLGRDLAESLGTAAVMSALVRTAIGEFQLDQAWCCDRLPRDNLGEWLHPPLDAVRGLPRVCLSMEQITAVAHGQFVTLPTAVAHGGDELAAVSPTGELVAILRDRGQRVFGPRINLASAV